MATTRTPRRSALTVAACALQVQPGQALQRLIPAGSFDAPRGSLAGQGPWRLDAAGAARIIAQAAARSTDIAVDYEHQILLAEKNGQPAPASGWIDRTSLQWLEGGYEPGLYGAVRWTPRAQQHVDAEEYRYLSPVFSYRPDTGEVLDILHVALTNTPGIDTAIVAAATRQLFQPSEEEISVNELLKKLLTALGLPDTTSEGDALAGVAALKTKAVELDTQIAALRTAAPDPAQFVPVAVVRDMQTQLAALTARMTDGEVSDLVASAIDAGKLLPAQKNWATDLGKKDIAALRAYVETAPQVAALGGMQSRGITPVGTGQTQSDADIAVCTALGLTPEQFAAGKIGA